jgi:hypothetical protein
MVREEIINLIRHHLVEIDRNSEKGLVNFVDDEIDWNEIATEVVDILEEAEIL